MMFIKHGDKGYPVLAVFSGSMWQVWVAEQVAGSDIMEWEPIYAYGSTEAATIDLAVAKMWVIIANKVSEGAMPAPEPPPPKPVPKVVDLMAALEDSLVRAKAKKRPAPIDADAEDF